MLAKKKKRTNYNQSTPSDRLFFRKSKLKVLLFQIPTHRFTFKTNRVFKFYVDLQNPGAERTCRHPPFFQYRFLIWVKILLTTFVTLGNKLQKPKITTNLSQDATQDMKRHDPKITNNSRNDVYPTIERNMCVIRCKHQACSNKKRDKQPEPTSNPRSSLPGEIRPAQQEVVTQGVVSYSYA